MKLINSTTKEEIRVGDTVKTFRGEKTRLLAIWLPGTSQGGKGGRVALEGTVQLLFPSVIGAEWGEADEHSSV